MCYMRFRFRKDLPEPKPNQQSPPLPPKPPISVVHSSDQLITPRTLAYPTVSSSLDDLSENSFVVVQNTVKVKLSSFIKKACYIFLKIKCIAILIYNVDNFVSINKFLLSQANLIETNFVIRKNLPNIHIEPGKMY
jgi:hypothetical protein